MRSERFWSSQKPGSDDCDSFVSTLERMVAASKTPPNLEDFLLELRYRRRVFFEHAVLLAGEGYALSDGALTTTRFHRFSLRIDMASRPSMGYW